MTIASPYVGKDHESVSSSTDKPTDRGGYFPSAPASFESWFKNRVISVLKVAVSTVTFLASGISLFAIGCGEWQKRARRCVLALGTTFQGLRQFIYCADSEDASAKNNTFLDRGRYVLQIGNLPATGGSEKDIREHLLDRKMLGRVWIRILFPSMGKPADVYVEKKIPEGTDSPDSPDYSTDC